MRIKLKVKIEVVYTNIIMLKSVVEQFVNRGQGGRQTD